MSGAEDTSWRRWGTQAPPTDLHPAPAELLMDMVLLDRLPPLSAVLDALQRGMGRAAEVQQGEGGTIVVDADGIQVFIAPMPGPVPDGEALANCHPIFWQHGTDPVRDHDATVLVTARLSDGRHGAGGPRSEALVLRTALARATVSLLQLSGAVGVYAGGCGTTFPARVYSDMTVGQLEDGDLPAMLWAPVWLLDGGDGSWSGYSYGLTQLGHAEIQVDRVRMAPNGLFTLLSDLVSYVVHGATLRPGETVSIDAEGHRMSAGTGPWAVDPAETAVTLSFLG